MPYFAGDIDFEEFESWYFNQDPKDQVRKREKTSCLALCFLLPLLKRFVDRRKVTSICQDRLGTNMTIHLTNETNGWCFGHRVLVTVFWSPCFGRRVYRRSGCLRRRRTRFH